LEEQADGSLVIEEVASAIRPDDIHQPPTRLISLENTHNRRGGTFQTPHYTRRLSEFAHEKGLVVHLDGARVFNAGVAQGIDVRELTQPVDSVTFCLSKGLCAPVGSVLCGDVDFIKKARRIRKQVGGGMRQAGVIAAAGIVALETMVDRLAEDHSRAAALAKGLMEIPGITLPFGLPATNMVFLDLSKSLGKNSHEIAAELKNLGVLVGTPGDIRFRLVTHYWVNDESISKVIDSFMKVLSF
jgi:threonine aldolase